MKNKLNSIGMRLIYGLMFVLTLATAFVAYATASPEATGLMVLANSPVWPFGELDLQQPAYAATLAIEITNHFTIIDPSILTGAMTINLTLAPTIRKGAMIFLEITATGTEVTTLGTGFTAPTFTGVAGKTKCQLLVYDGTSFKPSAVAFQID